LNAQIFVAKQHKTAFQIPSNFWNVDKRYDPQRSEIAFGKGPAPVSTMDDFAFYRPTQGFGGALFHATKFDFDLTSSSVFSQWRKLLGHKSKT
jgi:hypothetical protein